MSAGLPPVEIIDSLARLDEITKPIQTQRIVEARATFWAAIILLAIGTTIVVIGAFGGTQCMATKAIIGLLVNVIGGATLKLHKNAHVALERIWKDREAIYLISQMKDGAEKTQATRDFVKNLQEKTSWW